MRPATPPSAGAGEPWPHLGDDVARRQFGTPLIARGGLAILGWRPQIGGVDTKLEKPQSLLLCECGFSSLMSSSQMKFPSDVQLGI